MGEYDKREFNGRLEEGGIFCMGKDHPTCEKPGFTMALGFEPKVNPARKSRGH